MVGFSSVRELLFAKGYIKDRTRIEQPKLNLVTVGRESCFPSLLLSRQVGRRGTPSFSQDKSTLNCCKGGTKLKNGKSDYSVPTIGWL